MFCHKLFTVESSNLVKPWIVAENNYNKGFILLDHICSWHYFLWVFKFTTFAPPPLCGNTGYMEILLLQIAGGMPILQA